MEELLIKAGPDGVVALVLLFMLRQQRQDARAVRLIAAKVDALAAHFGIRVEAFVRVVPSSLASDRLRRRRRVAVPTHVEPSEDKTPIEPMPG